MANTDLDLPRLRQEMAAWPVGHMVDYQVSVPSTMPIAQSWAARGISGVVVLADEQSAGRGRLQRSWQAPRGQALLVSVSVCPPHLPAQPAQLPMIAGLAVWEALAAACAELRGQLWLKWPNDLLLGPDPIQAGKVCGLLVETTFSGDTPQQAVLGIGINVNQTAADLPPSASPTSPAPVSLRSRLQRTLSRTELLLALCRQLGQLLDPPTAPPPDQIHRRWQAHLSTVGRRVTLWPTAAPALPLTGLAIATTTTGELLLQADDGQLHQVAAGDVTFHLTGNTP